MRTINVEQITEEVAQMCKEAAYYLPQDVYEALKRGRATEESPVGCDVLDQIIRNSEIAREEDRPICHLRQQRIRQHRGRATALRTRREDHRGKGAERDHHRDENQCTDRCLQIIGWICVTGVLAFTAVVSRNFFYIFSYARLYKKKISNNQNIRILRALCALNK